jgi:diadenosine tetraphosphatase ApaH/serine/threonine PP2A family protein phosphatase
VLGCVEQLAVDRVLCLGDVVGYNADPEACLDLVLSRAALSVRGNHDKAVAGLMPLDWFNASARAAALWTRSALGQQSLDRVRALPEGPREAGDGLLLCHGSPYDEDAYVLDSRSIRESFECVREEHPGTRVCLVGHTHLPLVASWRPGEDGPRVHPPAARLALDASAAWLINPGSVGQPRDGNARASFGILDTNGMAYQNLRVEYPVREAQRKVIRAGLPDGLARRLAEGR